MHPEQNKIVFLLPWRDEVPVGGYKVAYEYANRFYRDGWNVTICYPHVRGSFKQDIKNPFLRLKMRVGFFYRFFKNHYKAGEWFPLESGIKKLFVFAISDFALRDYKDAKIIATAVETAIELNAVRSVPNANKFYFIQDFEAWNVSEDAVYASYRFPMKKITIADFLPLLLLGAGCAVSAEGVKERGGERQSGAETIRIVNWNAETFFDAHTEGSEYAEFKSSKSKWGSERYAARLGRDKKTQRRRICFRRDRKRRSRIRYCEYARRRRVGC